MGRAPKYTEDAILDAALELTADDGAHAATVVAIAKKLGAPSGSIYHRFPSRDLILATLWVRTINRFQTGFLAALAEPDTRQAARRAVAHILRWTSDHRNEAKLLTMYRRKDLLDAWPDELGAALTPLNDAVAAAVGEFVRRHFGTVDATTTARASFALIEIPYAAARHLLRDERAHPWLLEMTTSATLAALTAGEAPESAT
jgi:AcrR family transcriptional regulator